MIGIVDSDLLRKMGDLAAQTPGIEPLPPPDVRELPHASVVGWVFPCGTTVAITSLLQISKAHPSGNTADLDLIADHFYYALTSVVAGFRLGLEKAPRGPVGPPLRKGRT